MTEILIKTLPARTVASVRDVIDQYGEEGRLWQRLMEALPAAGGEVAEGGLAVAVFHDPDYVERGPDVEVQLDVVAPFIETGDVRCLHIPETEVVSGTLHGPYDGVGGVMEEVALWVDEHGYRFAGEMLNIYVVGPESGLDPSEWVTEVCLPVAATTADA